MADNQPVPLTPAPPGMVSLGVNENGEEEMTVIGGDGSGTGFSGNEAPIIPGSGSLQADLGKKSLTRLQAESSAAIHATAKWTTENLAKTQAAQAERAKAAMLSQQAAKAKQAKLTQHLKDVVDRALQNNKTRPTVIDLAHQNNQQMAAMAEFIGRQKAIEEARKKAEREAKRAEEAYQAALRAQEEEQRKQAEIERKLQEARKQEAAAKAKAEADRIAAEKAEAEARAKAEAERRKAEEARKALFAKAGIKDTPGCLEHHHHHH
uniref:Klebicin C activity n=1 Tax=Klebsiella quasipneumoniae TaxID=1463165 RepID=UPI001C20C4CE|nr:Chain D, Klebicin C activity [Klebsiella quasipneumoniae]